MEIRLDCFILEIMILEGDIFCSLRYVRVYVGFYFNRLFILYIVRRSEEFGVVYM